MLGKLKAIAYAATTFISAGGVTFGAATAVRNMSVSEFTAEYGVPESMYRVNASDNSFSSGDSNLTINGVQVGFNANGMTAGTDSSSISTDYEANQIKEQSKVAYIDPDLSYNEDYIISTLSILQSEYPNGTPWTNDTYYPCNGSGYSKGGFGCAGFAYMLSDAIFSPSSYAKVDGSSTLKPYDVIELFNGEHTAFVLDINDADNTVVVAEANINNAVRWGGVYNISDISSVVKRFW